MGKFAPVYLLVGEESYFIDETIKRLKKALGEGERSRNYDIRFRMNSQLIM